jgi:hypothetical protein
METELEFVSSRRRAPSSNGENSKPILDNTKYDCEIVELTFGNNITVR